MQKFLVIHCYNEPVSEYLKSIAEDYVIYHAKDSYSQDVNLRINEKEFVTKNYGHSLINFLTFIIDNYDLLPEKTIFVKNNILSRHTTKEFLLKAVDNDFYTPIYDDPTFPKLSKNGHYLSPGYFMERNTSWYVWESTHKYFTSFNSMLDFIFVNPRHPQYCIFAPGGCYVVTRNQILNYPKSFYQALVKIINYGFFPSEAWILERMLHTIFSCVYEIKDYMSDYNLVEQEIAALPNRISEKNPSKLIHKKILNRLKSILSDY